MAELKELYEQDSLKKTLLLTDGEVELTDENVVSEEFSIEQVLCDEKQLRIGTCNAATLKMKIHNGINSLKNRGLVVSQFVEGTDVEQKLGTFYVYSDKPTADRTYRDIVAYDRMQYILNEDVKEWYDAVEFPCTLKDFRNSFFTYMETVQEEVELINDNMIVEKTIEAEEISGKMVVEAICALNGCFGQMGYDDVFRYIFLQSGGIYPSTDLYPDEDLYPGQGDDEKYECYYISCNYEEYNVRPIESLQIRNEGDDIGTVVGNVGGNAYILEDNFLLYGKTPEILDDVAKKLFSVIKDIKSFTPYECVCRGNPARTIGTPIIMHTKDKEITSFILQRTITGVQALQDTYVAKGNEYYDKKVNGSNKSTILLKKRINKLTRTVDETKSEIERVETTLTDNYPTTTTMNSAINQSASTITLSVSRTYETKKEAETQYNALSTSVRQTAESINLKADKKGLIGLINVSSESVKISASKLELEGYATFTDINNAGFLTDDDLGPNGNTIINGGRIDTVSLFSRDITATKLKLTGESSLQLGASDVNEKQYIYLVGQNSGTVYETGLYPSRFYTLGNNGYSMNITPQAIAFGTSKGTALNINTDEDGVVWYSAGASHEFVGNVIAHSNLGFIDNGKYIDIVKTLKNARDSALIKLVDFGGNVI